jgi:hypothetical protein
LSNEPAARAERRRNVRACPKGTVILHAGTQVLRGRITDLGHGGLSAKIHVTTAEQILGREVELELRLDGQHQEWVKLTGKILRIGGRSIAVAFEQAPAAFTALIDATLTASHGHRRTLSIVLVDARTERRLPMAEAFRAAGCDVIDGATPLEAIVWLGESHFEPDLIVIADSFPGTIADELRRFVEAEHPAAKLVTIGDDLVEPAGLAHWLSSANPDDDLAERIVQLLTGPGQR